MSCPLQVYCSWIGVVSPNGVASWNVAFGSSVDVVTMLAVWSGLAGASVRPSCEHPVIPRAAATAKMINERERTRDESGSRGPPTEGTYGCRRALRAHPRVAARPSTSRRGSPNAKFGIFIHWGVFSIPAWAPTTGGMFDQPDPFRNTPYTEWYLNSLALDGSPVQAHHARPTATGYPTTRSRRSSRRPSPVGTRRSGPICSRRRALGTSCSSRSTTTASCSGRARTRTRSSTDGSSERDLVGELADAVRARGLTYGLYYSGGLDWTFGGLGIDSMRSLDRRDPAVRGVRPLRRRALARADRALRARGALERHRLSDRRQTRRSSSPTTTTRIPTASSTTASTSSASPVAPRTRTSRRPSTPRWTTSRRQVGGVPRHRSLVRAQPQRCPTTTS